MKTTLLGRRQATNESSDTPAALAQAFKTADLRVPERERAELFLQNHLEPPLAQLLERRAEILRGLSADGGLDALAAAELAPDGPAQQSPLNALTLPALEREIAVKRRAIQMQRDIVTRTRAEWAASVCDQLAPVHQRQVRRIAAAIEELSSALGEHRELVDALRDNEVMNFTLSLRPMLFVKDTMLLTDENSSASLWMRDARDNGLLD